MLAAAALVLRPTPSASRSALFGAPVARRRARGPAVRPDRHPPARLRLGPQHAAERAHRLRRGAAGRLGARRADGAAERSGAAAAAGARGRGRRWCSCRCPSSPSPPRRSACARCGGGLEIAWLFADPPGHPGPAGREGVIRLSALDRLADRRRRRAAALCCACGRPPPARAFVALAALLVCVDLFRAGMGQNPAIDREHAGYPRTGAGRSGSWSASGPPASPAPARSRRTSSRLALRAVRGARLRHADHAALRPPVAARDRRRRRDSSPSGLHRHPAASCRRSPRAAAHAAPARRHPHLPRPKSDRLASPPSTGSCPCRRCELPGLTVVYDGADARVYRVEAALPRALVVGAQRRRRRRGGGARRGGRARLRRARARR